MPETAVGEEPAKTRVFTHDDLPVVAVVSLGGGLGALARYGLLLLWPPEPGGFPVATFVTNAVGCLLIGALMVLVGEVWAGRRLVRPFLGTGVLGGFTTFSTYAVDVGRLFTEGAFASALVYLAGTVAAALTAAYTGIVLTRLLLRTRSRQ